ncbi:PIR Superfamily Protein [Plasmodium ovale wallikeri]|uniref:PIR protein n=2 Tax=Plasmodium ovale TaxID=36330 RepID=A0A1C3KJ95_PLAOA|nr:PIR Superfamily Protein [Plasmodium ovale wallikeri]SBT73931.1 hypothetical protein, conserved [Plasmodium ovale]
MTNGLCKDNLPSIKHFIELQQSMHYNDIRDSIKNTQLVSQANTWTSNINSYASSYLKKYPIQSNNKNHNKRCRDLAYFLEDIKTRIKASPLFDGNNSYIIGNIDNYLQHILVAEGYDDCPKNSTDENKLYTENNKKLDDLCEDITYINEKLIEINNSSQCKEIQDYIVGQEKSVRLTYNHSSSEHCDILKYYSYDTFENIEKIIKKIKCNNNHGDASEGTSQSSGDHAPILIVLPLLGIVLISFFLYKLTPLGPLLNTKIMKKIRYWKIINDKETDEILENTSDIPQTYLHDKEYHMLYNTLGDS